MTIYRTNLKIKVNIVYTYRYEYTRSSIGVRRRGEEIEPDISYLTNEVQFGQGQGRGNQTKDLFFN